MLTSNGRVLGIDLLLNSCVQDIPLLHCVCSDSVLMRCSFNSTLLSPDITFIGDVDSSFLFMFHI